MIIKGYIFSILYVLLCVCGAIILQKLGVEKKYTRKFIHIFVGFEWVILYHFMGPCIHFLAVCILFTLLLLLDYKLKLVPAMSSDGDNAPGTVYYAVAMTALAVLSIINSEMIIPFGIAVFCTSFGDGLAAVAGQSVKKNNPKIYGSKSLVGTLVNLAVCFAVPLIMGRIYSYPVTLFYAFIIAVFAAEIELFVGRGLDNIVLTISVAILAFCLVNLPETADYILPILLTPAIIALAYSKKALTKGGIFLAIIMDIVISVSLKNFGFAILLTFFVGSIVIDKIKKKAKKARQNSISELEKRGDCRDIVQVFSNGATASAFALCYLFTQNRLFMILFVASLAEAFADTAASGLGAFSNKVFDIFRMEKCEKGISGGMSVIGTVSSLFASFLISLLAFSFEKTTAFEFLIIGLSGFVGGLFDSMLGSLLQVKYKCSVCGKITEKESHCEKPALKYRGLSIFNNDVVNFLSTIFAAAFAALVFLSF